MCSSDLLIKTLVITLAGVGISLNFIEAFIAEGGVELFNSLTYIVVCVLLGSRSEERRVGKECRSRLSAYH